MIIEQLAATAGATTITRAMDTTDDWDVVSVTTGDTTVDIPTAEVVGVVAAMLTASITPINTEDHR